MRIAFGYPRLVRIETGFAETYEREAPKLTVVESFDWDMKPINLCESKFAVIERISDPATLAKQPVCVRDRTEHPFLDVRNPLSFKRTKAVLAAAD